MLEQPPKWALRFLALTCKDSFLDELEGDLLELFDRDVQDVGLQKARRIFAWKALTSVRWYRLPGINQFQPFHMWNNHFKMAYRHALKHKAVATINFVGLLFGIAAIFYIGLYLKSESSFDSMHTKSDQLYRVLRSNRAKGDLTMVTSSVHGKILQKEFPFVQTCSYGNDPVKIGDIRPQLVEEFYWADSSFFDFFSFDLLQGNPKTCLKEINSLVLTESLSMKVFGTKNALGKTIKVKVYDGDQEFQMKVTGVVADPPKHTHIQFEALGAMANAEDLYQSLVNQWSFSWLRTYANVPTGRLPEIEKAMPAILKKYLGDNTPDGVTMGFQPFDEVYLYSQHLSRNSIKGDYRLLYIFSGIGVLILLISLSNYINLTTARAVTRSKEVGIRKVLGTSNWGVFSQFIVESIFFTFFSGVLAIACLYVAMPYLNKFLELEQSFAVLGTLDWVLGVLGLLVVGVLAGILPAWSMTKLGMIGDSKAKINFNPNQGALGRKLFIGIQYVITIVLLVSATIIYQQYRYLKNFDLGFDADQVLHIPVDDRELQQKLMVMKEEFAQVGGVSGVTVTGEDLPSEMNNTWNISWSGLAQDDMRSVGIVGVDQDYFELMGIDFIGGENFRHGFAIDSARSVILNEKAMNLIGSESVIGKEVSISGKKRTVVGVVKNHHNISLHSKPVPMAFMVFPPGFRVSPDNLLVKVKTTNLTTLLGDLESVWQSFSPDPFVYNFIDEAFAEAYQQERQFSRLVSTFTLMAILISLIGLFGLVSFTTQLKLKEISIRRVLGATEANLMQLLGKEFVIVFMLALVLAAPLSLYLMKIWLDNYAYRIPVSFWYVILAGIICLGISTLVVFYHLQRTSKIAPGEVLGGE